MGARLKIDLAIREGASFRVMNENQIAKVIVETALQIHMKSGPGLLESVYEVILAHKLKQAGLSVQRQLPIPIRFDDLTFDEGFRADLLVNGKVIVELKSVESLLPVHSKQVLTQLRLGDFRLGLLINFGAGLLKNGLKRIANGMPDVFEV
jgi:GxxExxY protein